MKNKIKKYLVIILCAFMIVPCLLLTGCSQAATTRHNIQQEADKFNVYRRITFVNLQTGQLLYSAEGYFSLQTTYDNKFQGQQEIGLVFQTGKDKFKMDYFNINNNVSYVIEQLENTTTNPYYWKIVWYIAIPENVGG